MNQWNWAKQGGGLTHFSDRFLEVDTEIVWDRLGAGLDDAARDQLRRSWTLRTHDEYRSMVAFAELLQELTEIAAPIDVIGCATRVVRDETRHVELCARVVEALGGPADTGAPRWVRSDKKRSPRDRVAMTMVTSMCIGETISVALIAAALRETHDPVLHEVTRQILADESFHSRFGFDWVAATWRSLPMSTRLYVESSLPTRFARVERDQAPNRQQLFYQTITEKILPRLEAAGVRAERAWKQRAQ